MSTVADPTTTLSTLDLLEAEGIHIIVASERQQCFHPDAFTGLGCLDATPPVALGGGHRPGGGEDGDRGVVQPNEDRGESVHASILYRATD